MKELNRTNGAYEKAKFLWEQSKRINETGCYEYINGTCDDCGLCEIYEANSEMEWD